MGLCGEILDVVDLEQWVGWRLDPQHVHPPCQGCIDRPRVGEVDEIELQSELLEAPREEAERSTTYVIARHHPRAGAEQEHEGRLRRQPRGEGERASAVLDRCQPLLQRVPCRIIGPGVLIAVGQLVQLPSRERGAHVYGHHDIAAGLLLRLLTRMQRLGLETHLHTSFITEIIRTFDINSRRLRKKIPLPSSSATSPRVGECSIVPVC